MNRRRLPGLSTYVFVLALFPLALIVWGIFQWLHFPSDGLKWSYRSGSMQVFEAEGPAAGQLFSGDRILAIDGEPVLKAMPLYSGMHEGDQVTYLVNRQGTLETVTLRLAQTPPAEILLRLIPLLVAPVYWISGVYVLAYKPKGRQSLLFFLLSQIATVVLSAGSLSPISPIQLGLLFSISLWLLVPLTLNFHLYFPINIPSAFLRRLVILLYLIAITVSVLYVIWDIFKLSDQEVLPVLSQLRQFWLPAGLLGVVLLLAGVYRGATSAEVRRQVGVVAVGGALALVPLISLTLIPDAVIHQPFVPHELSFLFLLFVPLSYGYAVLHYRLIPLERFVSRGAASTLVFAMLASLYLLLYYLLKGLVPPSLWQRPETNLIVALLLVVAFSPLHRRVQNLVNYLFYGGWYDYRKAVMAVSHTLDKADGSTDLAQTLCAGLQSAMQLECAFLFLPVDEHHMLLAGKAGSFLRGQGPEVVQLDRQSPLAQYLLEQPGPVERTQLILEIKTKTLGQAESNLLACEQANWWIPLRGRERDLGILILGPRRGGGEFDDSDLEILDVVSWQAGVAIENAVLISELRQQTLARERLHKQVIESREEERKRVARELHDQIIQSLIGLNYSLSEIVHQDGGQREENLVRLQGDVRNILKDLRQICTGLRPPTLDSLGLVSALRSLLRNAERQGRYTVYFHVDGDEEQEVPEVVSLCLYRVLQEALQNIHKHTHAGQVEVMLVIRPDEISLDVEDDGHGFLVPQRLGVFTDDGHFGLLGLQERVELVGGSLEIVSAQGVGTRLQTRIPLKAKEESL